MLRGSLGRQRARAARRRREEQEGLRRENANIAAMPAAQVKERARALGYPTEGVKTSVLRRQLVRRQQ